MVDVSVIDTTSVTTCAKEGVNWPKIIDPSPSIYVARAILVNFFETDYNISKEVYLRFVT